MNDSKPPTVLDYRKPVATPGHVATVGVLIVLGSAGGLSGVAIFGYGFYGVLAAILHSNTRDFPIELFQSGLCLLIGGTLLFFAVRWLRGVVSSRRKRR